MLRHIDTKAPPPHTHATLPESKFPETTQDEFGGGVLEPAKQVNLCFYASQTHHAVRPSADAFLSSYPPTIRLAFFFKK